MNEENEKLQEITGIKKLKSGGVVCEKCGNYFAGHATGAIDVCTCNETTRIAKSAAQKRATRCRHFNGLQNDKCKAGVCYSTLQDNDMVLPCLPWQGDTDKPVAKCDKYGVYTAEEIAELARKIERSINNTITARKAIVVELARRYHASDKAVKCLNPDDEHRWYNPRKQENCFTGAGEMECPVCKTGKLRYSRASYNGHVHAFCSTEGCVALRE